MALSGFSPEDILKMRGSRYYVRWMTDLIMNEAGTRQIVVIGWCIYDRERSTSVYEHKDRQVVENMYKLLREEDNNVRGT
jgi:hypothetical protein